MDGVNKDENVSGNLFQRVYKNIQDRRERILSGKINCIPLPFPRFRREFPGIEQGRYYNFTANSKVGKTQITDSICLYNPVQQVIDNNLNIRLKIFYFTLEVSKEEKMLLCFSNILWEKEGIRISPLDLKSTDAERPLSQETLDILNKYKPYFDKIEEVVEFVDSVRNPTGIYNLLERYALAHGKIHKRKMEIDNKEMEVFDYYEPNDPDEYVMLIIDHVGLITPEKSEGVKLDLRESIGLLSSNYLIRLRNRFNYIPIVIQQQASGQESVENKKYNKLKPTLDGLGVNKNTQQDANVVFGLFSPFRHEIPEYLGYDVTKFGNSIRFLEILANREGNVGGICPLYFDGAVNYFKELPLPKDKEGMQEVYKFIEKVRKGG